MRSRAPSSAEEVWGEASLLGSCTVQALLCSDRSPLRNWTLSLAILAITSTHLKAQALRWAQGTSGEPAGTAGAAAAGGAAAVATPAVVPAPGAAASEAAEPGATTAEAEAVPKAAAAAGATPEAAAAEAEAAKAAPGAAAEAKAAAEVAAEAGGRQPCAKRQNNKWNRDWQPGPCPPPWLLQHLPLPSFGRLMGAHLAAGRVGDKCSSITYPRGEGGVVQHFQALRISSEEHASSRQRTCKTQNLGSQQRTLKAKENYKIK